MSLFDFVKSNISILDVIGQYVKIKSAGSYWKGPCPFHAEKDASFTVSPDKQIFYCFGCHAGGDLISFVAKIENMSQIEAVNFLVDKYGLQIPDDIKRSVCNKNVENKKDQQKNYFKLCQSVAIFANRQLLSDVHAFEYLKKRNISKSEIEYFNIGYFPGGIRFINNFVREMSNQSILVKDLLENGILMEGKSVLYSPFEERIIFPIKDSMGRFCGFGGRIFKNSDQRAKYYNSKESQFFSKGKLLFGLDLAKKEMQTKKYAFLVEGYFDCITMAKYEYKNTVATLGTACTQNHLDLLSRFINTLYVLYDGDVAGQNAILRLTQLCWNVNMELRIIKFPAKDDPDSFLNKNGNLDLLINQAEDIFSFFIDNHAGKFLNASLSEKIDLSQKIIQLITNLNDSFKQDILLQRAAKIMQMPIQILKKQITSIKNNSDFAQPLKKTVESIALQDLKNKNNKNADSKEISVSLLEERIFSAIINNMDKTEKFIIDENLISYFEQDIQFLLDKVGKSEKFKDFLNLLDEYYRDWVIKCSLKFEPVESEDLFEQLLFLFYKENWKKIVQDMRLRILKSKQQGNTQDLQRLLSVFSKFKKNIQSRGLI
ncbi:DNA primase [Candidatus Babeliales bacterium]|nr:DNA primase [Candidatus Babeliales bacterium]MCF7899100.1 DNA primase [Candidatus Babeliales bacterium]